MTTPANFLLLILLFATVATTAMAAYNIVALGARPDGRTDSARPLLRAWAASCGGRKPTMIYVLPGRFYLGRVVFQGPCRNTGVKFLIHGTFIAPAGYSSSSTMWISFQRVQGLSIYGGTLDGRGQSLWACKLAGRSCPIGTSSLTISQSKNVLISGLTSINPELFHINLFGSTGVTSRGIRIRAPDESPNTDGIHMQESTGVSIRGSTIGTGDDCISMKPGTANILIEHVTCGPGHGISIGSLGGAPGEPGVQNITVKSVVFTGTQNGVRIKTRGTLHSGFVRGVSFRHVVMKNVRNPIIVDQNYCPSNYNCPGQGSGIKIDRVSFKDIQGTSATKMAMKFDCSPRNPCTGIGLKDIKLTYQNMQAQSYCTHARGRSSGYVNPPSCL